MIVSSYDHDRLWMKGCLFASRAMDQEGDFPESAFWAASAMELIGKAFLASINPLLIANPTGDDGHSMLVASGVIADVKFYSVSAKAVWSRCRRAFHSFKHDEATRISQERNDYIHGGLIGFEAVDPDVWWAKYWAVVVPLLSAYGKETWELVGHTRALEVERFLAANNEYVRGRVEALKERALTRLQQHRNGTLSAREAAEWAAFTTRGWVHELGADCPACGEAGLLQGDDSIDTRVEVIEYARGPEEFGFFDERLLWLLIGAEQFACPNCHLRLEGLEEIAVAGLEESFEVEGDPSDITDVEEYMNE